MAEETTSVVTLLTNNADAMRSITTFDDAVALLAQSGIDAVDYSSEYGDGFELIKGDDGKATLIDQEFIIMGIRFVEGDFENDEGVKEEFAVVHIVTRTGRKVILVDGGTGVCAQARDMQVRGHSAGVFVKNGLRRSDYTYVDAKGKKSPATTFYFSS